MAELRFTAKFADDLEDIARYIERDSATLAKEFVRRLLSQLEVLKSNRMLKKSRARCRRRDSRCEPLAKRPSPQHGEGLSAA